MSVFDRREDVCASPLRARSLLTVRAAISSARSSEEPRSRSESLMCSYWRARFVPFFTPRGGIGASFRSADLERLDAPSIERQTFRHLPEVGIRKALRRKETACTSVAASLH